METVLLRALQAKDLGNTGFVTGNEISATLTELSQGKAMSEAETEQLMENLGIPQTESGGFPYNDIIPYLANAIESRKSES
jgi:Ca2+-binding EF-hand superfamily protein